MGGGYDFIALTEIEQNNLDSRRAALIRDIGYEFKNDKLESIRKGLIYNQNLKLIERNDLKLSGSRELKLENIWVESQFPDHKDNYVRVRNYLQTSWQ